MTRSSGIRLVSLSVTRRRPNEMDRRILFMLLVLCSAYGYTNGYTLYADTERPQRATTESIIKNGDYYQVPATSRSYKLQETPATFDQAKTICEAEEATFFYPENHRELKSVLMYWQSVLEKHFPQRLLLGWKRPKDDHTMLREHVAVNSMFHNWSKTLPINTSGNENCMQITYVILPRNAGIEIWVLTVSCDEKRPFVCVKETNDVTSRPRQRRDIDDPDYGYNGAADIDKAEPNRGKNTVQPKYDVDFGEPDYSYQPDKADTTKADPKNGKNTDKPKHGSDIGESEYNYLHAGADISKDDKRGKNSEEPKYGLEAGDPEYNFPPGTILDAAKDNSYPTMIDEDFDEPKFYRDTADPEYNYTPGWAPK